LTEEKNLGFVLFLIAKGKYSNLSKDRRIKKNVRYKTKMD
jgi:hypothetical protein